MKIAIVGGGLSGSLVTMYLIRQTTEPLVVYLFEKKPAQLNKGVAYSSQLPYQLLNVTVKNMSLFGDDPAHFSEWLKAKGYEYQTSDFAPRDVYGEYITDTFQKETKSRRGSELRIIQGEVTGVAKAAKGYKVSFRQNESILADKVILCTGNFPPGDVPGLPQDVKESKNYISHPWSGFNVKSIPNNNNVLMVGSGLTMIDLVLSLQKNGHKGKITVISRRGLLPLPHGEAPEYKPGKKPDLKNATLSSILEWVKENVREATETGKNWRSAIDAMRSYIPAFWGALTLEERKRFIRHLRPFWEIHRHRMPKESIDILEKMQKDGKLTLLAGRIQSAEKDGELVEVTYKSRNNNSLQHIAVHNLINCTGPETEYRKLRSPLYQSLVENKLAQTEPLALGLLATTTGFIINASGEVDNNIAVIGPPAKGVLWECTALREIRLQAASLAKAILGNS